MASQKWGWLKPAVPKFVLFLISGLMWFGVGIFLNSYAVRWINSDIEVNRILIIGVGILLALIIHRLGFSKIVLKNNNRISQMNEFPCIFSFMTWKSYLLVLVMVSLGITLRLSSIPLSYLAVIYIAIGCALIISSIKYYILMVKNISIKKNGN
ncbi:MAG: hypothetical protein GY834_01070 [Bacteroidetes bacterium]|nr:hypothetical protein [Bacteroidota bacterium]